MQTRLQARCDAESIIRVTRSMARKRTLNDVTNVQQGHKHVNTSNKPSARPVRLSPSTAYKLSTQTPPKGRKRPLDEEFIDPTTLRLPGRDPPIKRRRVRPSKSKRGAEDKKQEVERATEQEVPEAGQETIVGPTQAQGQATSELEDPNRKPCQICGKINVQAPTSNTDADKGWINCECGNVYCWRHGHYHAISCAEFNLRLRRTLGRPAYFNPLRPWQQYYWDNRDKLYSCPNERCREMNVFEGGCPHLICPSCGQEWCKYCDRGFRAILYEGPWHHSPDCHMYAPRQR